jgi:hypothetical protein
MLTRIPGGFTEGEPSRQVAKSSFTCGEQADPGRCEVAGWQGVEDGTVTLQDLNRSGAQQARPTRSTNRPAATFLMPGHCVLTSML